ncbi:hypothetical protein MMC07_001448 [Pseudocyphellaria aurata]|nr:hypothetical protein [Pseudocyphellaria aurata]
MTEMVVVDKEETEEQTTELEALTALDDEALIFKRDAEVGRVLDAFKNDAYAILDLQYKPPGSKINSEVKARYHSIARLIHPDHLRPSIEKKKRVDDAMARLNEARDVLNGKEDEDIAERAHLDKCIKWALEQLLGRKLTDKTTEPEMRQSYEEGSKMMGAWRRNTVGVLYEEAKALQQRMKGQKREEQRERRRTEEDAENRKRQREHDNAWEDSREGRIKEWTKFRDGKTGGSGGRGAKDGGAAVSQKKKKIRVLG